MTTPNMKSPEAFAAEGTANAVHFTASLFLGRGKYAKAEAANREAIDAAAAKLVEENPTARAKPIIVAFDGEGNQAMISGKPRKAAKAEKPANAPKAAKAAAPEKHGKRAEILASAEAGILPAKPDFSAATHARFRKRLDKIAALVEKGDVKALKAFPINPISSSPKAMDKYRNLAVIALEAQRKAAKAEAKVAPAAG
ncbi:hypothetical protein [Rhizobium giardinii]|uniref:hypothetical protein n=1 Tax=Rhizobium giardinii TaxID=56731 RepID=UPI003D6E2797